ncbi:MAG: SAM-dependent methyltransferase, partial [Planctomycetota bacterium]
FLAGPTLRFMDYIGNAHHGVSLPYNYLSTIQWQDLLQELQIHIETWNARPTMYGVPGDWLFGRRLHVVMRLEKE